MKGNCFKCAKSVMMPDGRIWCSQDKCEYEPGNATMYRPERGIIDKKTRGKK